MEHKSVYLDYNATTPLEPEVLESINTALRDAWGNPSSCYKQGKTAKTIIENARLSIAGMLGGRAEDVIFTSGGTEANNMVIQTAVKWYLEQKKTLSDQNCIPHFITSNLEHDSVRLVLQQLENDGIAEVTYVKASNTSGRVEVPDVTAAVKPNTCMVTIMLANNETGVIQPIKEITKAIKSVYGNCKDRTRILVHTDAAQAIGKVPVDVMDLDVDYLTVVGHKFYAPRIGALYVQGLAKQNPLYPLLYGGGQERNYRPGTENTGMIAGLGKAAEMVTSNIARYESHYTEIRDYLERRLNEEFSVQVNGKFKTSERLPNTCNVSFLGDGLQGNQILAACKHLQASVGAACHSQNSSKPSPILLAIGVAPEIAINAVRLSVGRETTKNDIDIVIDDLKQAVQSLKL